MQHYKKTKIEEFRKLHCLKFVNCLSKYIPVPLKRQLYMKEKKGNILKIIHVQRNISALIFLLVAC